MVKSVSESSSLSTISTSINKSSQDNTNQLSSIPERANDSTLIGNHHHLSKHKQNSSTQLNAQSELKTQRNVEIQTSPDQQHTSSTAIRADELAAARYLTSLFNSSENIDSPVVGIFEDFQKKYPNASAAD
jgi:hypothetical protein